MGRCYHRPKAAVYIHQLDRVSCKTATLCAAATRRSRRVHSNSVGVTSRTIFLRVVDSRLMQLHAAHLVLPGSIGVQRGQVNGMQSDLALADVAQSSWSS